MTCRGMTAEWLLLRPTDSPRPRGGNAVSLSFLKHLPSVLPTQGSYLLPLPYRTWKPSFVFLLRLTVSPAVPSRQGRQPGAHPHVVV